MPRINTSKQPALFLLLAAMTFAAAGAWLAAPVAAQCARPGFKILTNNFPAQFGTLTADFNLDGKLDLAGRDNGSTNKVFIMLGDGAGHFGVPTFTTLAGNLLTLETGDFNGDGKPDLMAAGYSPNLLWVLHGNGAAGFPAPATTDVSGFQYSFTVTDLDGDGKSDIVLLADSMNGSFQTRFSDGTGHFTTPASYSSTGFPRVAAGDFNGDGKSDLAVSYYNPNSISFYINSGAGFLNAMPAASLTGLPGGQFLLTTADFNHDSKTDLIYLNQTTNIVSIFINNGAVSFTRTDYPVLAHSSQARTGDFNGDGKLDLIVGQYPGFSGGGRVTVLSGDGTGGFTNNVYRGPSLNRGTTGEFTGDNITDVLDIFYNNTTGATSLDIWVKSCNVLPNPKGIVDYDGDGSTDLAVWRPSDGNWIIKQSSDGVTRTQQWGSGSLGDKPAPGDYDGDGKSDLAVFRTTDGSWYILNSSNATLTGYKFGTSDDKPVQADYDGDGKTDIAVYRPSTGAWYILRSSDGALNGVAFDTAEDKPVPADYDGDDKADVAVFRPSGGCWYTLHSSDNSFSAQAWGISTDKPVPGDYDRDGKADIAVFRPGNAVWYLYSSYYGELIAVAFASNEAGLQPAPGDYDGDGVTDTAFRRPGDNLWFINGSSSPYDGTYQPLGSGSDVPVSSAYLIE